jgi:hypothetical protein
MAHQQDAALPSSLPLGANRNAVTFARMRRMSRRSTHSLENIVEEDLCSETAGPHACELGKTQAEHGHAFRQTLACPSQAFADPGVAR